MRMHLLQRPLLESMNAIAKRSNALEQLSYYTLIVTEPEGPTGIAEDTVMNAALQYVEIGALPKVVLDDAP